MYACFPSEVTATPCGWWSGSGTLLTWLFDVLITYTPSAQVTNTSEPSGDTVTIWGASPTLIVLVSFWLATSTTDTVSEPPGPVFGPVLATYAVLPSGEIAIPCG